MMECLTLYSIIDWIKVFVGLKILVIFAETYLTQRLGLLGFVIETALDSVSALTFKS